VNFTGDQAKPNAVAIIPARFASSRLPGKPLLDIAGKPMICRVVERTLAAPSIGRAIVATDDQRVLDVVRLAGFEGAMTRSDHISGTDRLAEVAGRLSDAEIIVNVQGDEPLISPETIELAIAELISDSAVQIVTTWEPLETAADVLDDNVVKVVIGGAGQALYFSRAPIPFLREGVRRHGTIIAALQHEREALHLFRKHTGLYVYRRNALLQFAGWQPSDLERAESLEQLRALEHGMVIKVVQACAPSIGVDTPEDLARVRQVFAEQTALHRARHE
jgi:3-deoxy-manno-octulosonate cytidylyltransferase (CMP-KDO synthetase)